MNKLKTELSKAIEDAKRANAKVKQLRKKDQLNRFRTACKKRFGRTLNVGDLLTYTDLHSKRHTIRVREIVQTCGTVELQYDQLIRNRWMTSDNWETFSENDQYHNNPSFDYWRHLFDIFELRLAE